MLKTLHFFSHVDSKNLLYYFYLNITNYKKNRINNKLILSAINFFLI